MKSGASLSSLAIYDEIKLYVLYHFKTFRIIFFDGIILPERVTKLGVIRP